MTRTSRDRAVDALVAVGLREYEAKCFVALSQLSEATAKDVSVLADVPRSRVYDSMESLTAAGLVDTQQTKPIRYRAVPKEDAIDLVERDHRTRLDEVRDSLSQLAERSGDQSDEVGLWTLGQSGAITRRGEELIRGADDAVYIATGRGQQSAATTWLEAAAERALSVSGTLPTELRSPAAEAIDGDALAVAFVEEPRLDGITRLLVTDQGTALVATRTGPGAGPEPVAPTRGSPPADDRELGVCAEPTGLGSVVSRLVGNYASSLPGRPDFSFETGSA